MCKLFLGCLDPGFDWTHGISRSNLISNVTVEFRTKLCWIRKLHIAQSNTNTELSEIRKAMPRNQLSRVKRKKETAERLHLGIKINSCEKIAIEAMA